MEHKRTLESMDNQIKRLYQTVCILVAKSGGRNDPSESFDVIKSKISKSIENKSEKPKKKPLPPIKKFSPVKTTIESDKNIDNTPPTTPTKLQLLPELHLLEPIDLKFSDNVKKGPSNVSDNPPPPPPPPPPPQPSSSFTNMAPSLPATLLKTESLDTYNHSPPAPPNSNATNTPISSPPLPPVFLGATGRKPSAFQAKQKLKFVEWEKMNFVNIQQTIWNEFERDIELSLHKQLESTDSIMEYQLAKAGVFDDVELTFAQKPVVEMKAKQQKQETHILDIKKAYNLSKMASFFHV